MTRTITTRPIALVTLEAGAGGREVLARELSGVADIVHLADLDQSARAAALARADVVIARNTAKELRPGEERLLARTRLVQFVTAGVDYVPLKHFPADLPIAANRGAYAEPMAEHALAMALAAAKRLVVEHKKLERGAFDQFRPNRTLAGGTCAILGYGGIGAATARLFRAVGMRVHAINRRATGDDALDWIGGLDKLDAMLAAADVLVVTVPLTTATAGMIAARQLGLMKPDAILINLARGEIVDEAALYDHLVTHPEFTACIDAWWIEPIRHGRFAMERPFMTLANVIGSPHNSASVANARDIALTRACANCRRVLAGETPHNLIGPEERML